MVLRKRAKLDRGLLAHYFRSMFAVDGIGACDDNLTHSGIDSIEGIFNLRNHTTSDSAVSLILFEVSMGDVGDDAVIIVGIAQYTLLFEAIDERGAIIVGKSLCCFCRYCVGIGIQDIAFSVMSQRSDDGSNAIFDEIGKNLCQRRLQSRSR